MNTSMKILNVAADDSTSANVTSGFRRDGTIDMKPYVGWNYFGTLRECWRMLENVGWLLCS